MSRSVKLPACPLPAWFATRVPASDVALRATFSFLTRANSEGRAGQDGSLPLRGNHSRSGKRRIP